MKFFIPEIGFKFKLTKDCEVRLFHEHRNKTAFHNFNIKLDTNKINCFEKVTIPAGAILDVDRIYIRNGADDFSSLTFVWSNPKVGGKMFFGKSGVRFWIKLEEVNNFEFEEYVASTEEANEIAVKKEKTAAKKGREDAIHSYLSIFCDNFSSIPQTIYLSKAYGQSKTFGLEFSKKAIQAISESLGQEITGQSLGFKREALKVGDLYATIPTVHSKLTPSAVIIRKITGIKDVDENIAMEIYPYFGSTALGGKEKMKTMKLYEFDLIHGTHYEKSGKFIDDATARRMVLVTKDPVDENIDEKFKFVIR